MLVITYLNDFQQEKTISYDTYAEYVQSQQSCQLAVADHYPIIKLTYKGKNIAYSGNLGELFFFLQKQSLN